MQNELVFVTLFLKIPTLLHDVDIYLDFSSFCYENTFQIAINKVSIDSVALKCIYTVPVKRKKKNNFTGISHCKIFSVVDVYHNQSVNTCFALQRNPDEDV